MKTLSTNLKEQRSTLFNESNEVVSWKCNELRFYDQQLEVVLNLEKLLQEKKSIFITNCEIIKRRLNASNETQLERKRKLRRQKEGARKEKKAKLTRLLNNCDKLMNVLTKGKLKFGSKVKLEHIDVEAKLLPRFHLKPIQKLLDDDLVDIDALQIVMEMRDRMEGKKMKL